MNLYCAVVKIISKPKVIKIKNRIALIMLVCIPSNTKTISFFKIYVLLNQFILKKFFLSYKINDVCFLEGNTKILYMQKSNLLNSIHNKKKFKYIKIYVKSSQILIQKKF